jgi:hypothetical protein
MKIRITDAITRSFSVRAFTVITHEEPEPVCYKVIMRSCRTVHGVVSFPRYKRLLFMSTYSKPSKGAQLSNPSSCQ